MSLPRSINHSECVAQPIESEHTGGELNSLFSNRAVQNSVSVDYVQLEETEFVNLRRNDVFIMPIKKYIWIILFPQEIVKFVSFSVSLLHMS